MSIYEHTYIATPDCNKKDLEVIEKKIVDILANNSGTVSYTHLTLPTKREV